MKTLNCKIFLLVASVMLIAGCGGSGSSSGSGGTSSREVTGSVPTTSGSTLVKGLAGDSCVADTVFATSSAGKTVTAEVDEDCFFSLTLSVGNSYVISLAKDGSFVATLIFDSAVGSGTNTSLPIGEGEGDIDLGTITIEGEVASAEIEPCEYYDFDDDGEDSCEDLDDDGDGEYDDEEDCDEDGYWDDYDDDCDCDDDDDDDEDDDEDEDDEDDDDDF